MGETEKNEKHDQEKGEAEKDKKMEEEEKDEEADREENKGQEKTKDEKKKKSKEGKSKEDKDKKKKNPQDKTDPEKLKQKLEKIDTKIQALLEKKQEILKLLQEAEQESANAKVCHRRSHSFSSFSSDNLQLCTEGLGFESTDELEDTTDELNVDRQDGNGWEASSGRLTLGQQLGEDGIRSRSSRTGDFPPPISSIGKSWVSFRSYKHDGRFVLKEIRTPTHDLLYASREDGRLKLQFLHPSDDILQDEDEDEDEDEREGNHKFGDADSVGTE